MKCERAIQKLKEGKRLTIAALGDSLTYGWMVRAGFVDILEDMLKDKYPQADFKIIKRGVPGDTAQGGILRVKRDVISAMPDLVMVQFALNDALSGYSPAEFYSNMKRIAAMLKEETNSEILLMTSPFIYNKEMMRLAKPYYDKICQISEEMSLPIALVDKYWEKKIADGTNHHELVQSDMAHPTEAGYRLMAEAVMELFQ